MLLLMRMDHSQVFQQQIIKTYLWPHQLFHMFDKLKAEINIQMV